MRSNTSLSTVSPVTSSLRLRPPSCGVRIGVLVICGPATVHAGADVARHLPHRTLPWSPPPSHTCRFRPRTIARTDNGTGSGCFCSDRSPLAAACILRPFAQSVSDSGAAAPSVRSQPRCGCFAGLARKQGPPARTRVCSRLTSHSPPACPGRGSAASSGASPSSASRTSSRRTSASVTCPTASYGGGHCRLADTSLANHATHNR